MVCLPHRGIVMGLAGYSAPPMTSAYAGMQEMQQYNPLRSENRGLLTNENGKSKTSYESVEQMLYTPRERSKGMLGGIEDSLYATQDYFSAGKSQENPLEYMRSGQGMQRQPLVVGGSIPNPLDGLEGRLGAEKETLIIPQKTPLKTPLKTSPKRTGRESQKKRQSEEMLDAGYSTAQYAAQHAPAAAQQKEETEELQVRQASLAKKILHELDELDMESPGELALTAVELLL